jgi:hypothetical protein
VAESIACFQSTGDGSECVGNPRQVIRRSSGDVELVTPEFINANNLDVEGLDINTSYSWEASGLGAWRVGLQAAWIHKYNIGIPTAQGVNTFEGAGSRNAGNEVGRPLPEWKVNGTLSWNLGDHSAFLIVKYVDGYRHDTPQSPFNIALAERELGIDLNTPTVKSHTTADLQYSYTLPAIALQSAGVVTIGIRNVTNESPSLSNQTHTFESTLHDPLGRIWYLRYWLSI